MSHREKSKFELHEAPSHATLTETRSLTIASSDDTAPWNSPLCWWRANGYQHRGSSLVASSQGEVYPLPNPAIDSVLRSSGTLWDVHRGTSQELQTGMDAGITAHSHNRYYLAVAMSPWQQHLTPDSVRWTLSHTMLNKRRSHKSPFSMIPFP